MNSIEIKDESVNQILDRLGKAGYRAFIVGGCVRDMLLGLQPHDYDMTTNATPEEIKQVFRDCPLDETGIAKGTIRLTWNNRQYEITSHRLESDYKDHRHPETIIFTTSLKDDLARRDFTINALAYNGIDGLIDYFNGLSDLQAGILRTIGDPAVRFEEDSLRILRALRFAARFNLKIDPETAIALLEKRDLLKCLSNERIYEEFSGLIMSDYCDRILYLYKDCIITILPIVQEMSENDYYDMVHVLPKIEKDIACRLAVFFHQCRNYKDVLTQFHVESKVIQKSELLISHFYDFIELDTVSLKKMLQFMDLTTLHQLINIQYQTGLIDRYFTEQYELLLNKIETENQAYKLSQLAINGIDLIALGYQGQQIGQMLEMLLNEVIEEKVENERIALVNFLLDKQKNIYKDHYQRLYNQKQDK